MNSPLFCANCHTLYPAEGLNHFELLGLEPAYDLDPAELRRRYLQCSREVHPDHHPPQAADNGDAAAVSLRTTARLNEAYRVLADPLLRAEYLLELLGGRSSADDKSVPQQVLTRTLMLREEIEEAREDGDEKALRELRERARSLRDEALTHVADLARRLPGSDETRRELRQRLNAVKYYQKLLEQF